MILLIDTNEKSTNPKVFQSIKKHFSVVILRNLTAGDIQIPLESGGVLCIERKTPDDFLQSIADGRIFEQINTMQSDVNVKFSAFIVTGYFTYSKQSDIVMIEGEKTKWTGRSVRSVMTLIQYSGCALLFCPPSELCNQIEELYSTVNKPTERRHPKVNKIITFPPVDDRVNILCSLPGVGLKLAESLLKFAGKMENNADENGYGTLSSALHWLTIMGGISKSERPAGWGPAKILTIRKALGLNSNEYINVNQETGE